MSSNEQWWEEACAIIRKSAFQHESQENPRGRCEVETLAISSSRHHVSTEAIAFLGRKGPNPHSTEQAYAMILSFAEQEATDRTGTKVLRMLRTTLHTEPASPYAKQQPKMEIARLVRELQNRHKAGDNPEKARDPGG